MSCPRCQYDKPEKPRIDEETKREFFRSLLGNRPFVHRYPLLGGELVFAFSNLTAKEAETLDRLTAEIEREVQPADPQKASILYTRTKLYFHLEECSLLLGKRERLPRGLQELETVLDDFVGKFANSVYNLAVKALSEFIELKNQLYEECLDANFWKGAGRN